MWSRLATRRNVNPQKGASRGASIEGGGPRWQIQLPGFWIQRNTVCIQVISKYREIQSQNTEPKYRGRYAGLHTQSTSCPVVSAARPLPTDCPRSRALVVAFVATVRLQADPALAWRLRRRARPRRGTLGDGRPPPGMGAVVVIYLQRAARPLPRAVRQRVRPRLPAPRLQTTLPTLPPITRLPTRPKPTRLPTTGSTRSKRCGHARARGWTGVRSREGR